ncbi:MAG: surfeit locus 1 family protein [Halocynthiibacter sp.]|jgi:surfeit locus 1 family protein
MLKRMSGPIIIGLGGIAILLSLGFWQVQRLSWKQSVLADIEARISAPAVPLGVTDTPDKYAPVSLTGKTFGPEIHVLVSRKQIGAGYRIITGFETDQGRKLLLDRGFVKLDAADTPRPEIALELTGNIHTPDDRTSSTPPNDAAKNIWFARDIPDMAAALQTEPLLIIARSDTGQGVEAMPVGPEGIPNDHLQYAITWFSLALVWLGMTLYQLWRIRTKPA